MSWSLHAVMGSSAPRKSSAGPRRKGSKKKKYPRREPRGFSFPDPSRNLTNLPISALGTTNRYYGMEPEIPRNVTGRAVGRKVGKDVPVEDVAQGITNMVNAGRSAVHGYKKNFGFHPKEQGMIKKKFWFKYKRNDVDMFEESDQYYTLLRKRENLMRDQNNTNFSGIKNG